MQELKQGMQIKQTQRLRTKDKQIQIPKNLFSYPQTEPTKKKRSIFTLLVRRRGKFAPVGTYKTYGEAFGRGKTAVDVSAAASFKVVDKQDKVVYGNSIFDRLVRPSKREKGVFIERNKFRISTGGEKGEITFKGLQKIKNMWR